MDKRGTYKRAECQIHGRGHRYSTTKQEAIEFENRVELRTFKICECGNKKLLFTDTESRIQGHSTGEKCRNPWKANCPNTKISLSIVFKGEERPICAQCWEEISESDIEW